MDDVRFDSLAKTHAAIVGSRRRLLGALSVGLLGAAPAMLNGSGAAAKGKSKNTAATKKKKKPTPSTCSKGVLYKGRCCKPKTCAGQGKNCGALSDGCGGKLQCGSCPAPQTCGGGSPRTPNVCGCTKETCAANECGQRSDGCGGTLICIPASDDNRCWVLAGGDDPFGPDARILVDDDLTISVNERDQVVAKDDDGRSGKVGPFVFPAAPGDRLFIVATDVQAGFHQLGPLYLWSASSGGRQVSDGFPRTEEYPQPAGTFFDESFIICLERGQLCTPGRDECCGHSCCGSEDDPTNRCRGGCG